MDSRRGWKRARNEKAKEKRSSKIRSRGLRPKSGVILSIRSQSPSSEHPTGTGGEGAVQYSQSVIAMKYGFKCTVHFGKRAVY